MIYLMKVHDTSSVPIYKHGLKSLLKGNLEKKMITTFLILIIDKNGWGWGRVHVIIFVFPRAEMT